MGGCSVCCLKLSLKFRVLSTQSGLTLLPGSIPPTSHSLEQICLPDSVSEGFPTLSPERSNPGVLPLSPHANPRKVLNLPGAGDLCGLAGRLWTPQNRIFKCIKQNTKNYEKKTLKSIETLSLNYKKKPVCDTVTMGLSVETVRAVMRQEWAYTEFQENRDSSKETEGCPTKSPVEKRC